MKRLGNRNGYTHCTAKKLLLIDLKSIYKDGTTLVIDALDEATSQHDGDAISQVLKKLAALGFPRFILSCRVAEWHSFTNNSTIRDVGYDQEPLEVHLQPFSEEEIHSFLANRLGAPRATEVNAHFEQLGLVDWLGNPQTLDLICSVATKAPCHRIGQNFLQWRPKSWQQNTTEQKPTSNYLLPDFYLQQALRAQP